MRPPRPAAAERTVSPSVLQPRDAAAPLAVRSTAAPATTPPRRAILHAATGFAPFHAEVSEIVVPTLAARRFMRHAVGLDAGFPDVQSALAHLGYVQIDPINVCGRMHDLILRNRVANYAEGDLARCLYGEHPHPPRQPDERFAFEHHLPDAGTLVAFELEAWPHLRAAMRARTRRSSAWSGRLTPRERALAPHLLAEITRHGPRAAEDFADHGRAHRPVWGAASLVKSTLQKLFFHGRLLIAGRLGNRRRYDLPERVLPTRVLTAPEPTAEETARWLVLLRLRQRRLVALKRDELPLVTDAVQRVRVAGAPPLYCRRQDASALLAAESSDPDPARPLRLLAPLDPLIYDRRVTAALWNFNYIWEAYTPPAKRTRGYYALPVLAGSELVGHVDLKADRAGGRLEVVSRRIARGHPLAGTLHEFARWLGLPPRGTRLTAKPPARGGAVKQG